jgi:hypothetical protein
MNRTALSLAALLALSIVTLPPATAQVSAVPQIMNFQGRLATPSGNPVPDGTYSIRFSLWNVASGGTAATNEKWNQTVSNVQVKNGTFAVSLNVSGGAADKFNGNLWLEIKIGSNAPLTPRTPLASMPYAFRADTLTLPFAATGAASGSNALVRINNTGNGISIWGDATGEGIGIGVYGKSLQNAGVQGESRDYAGVVGYGRSATANGVLGISFGGSRGFLGSSTAGVYGSGISAHGVYGYTQTAAYGGVVGDNANGDRGVLAGPGYAVAGASLGGVGGDFSTTGADGVRAVSFGFNGNGVVGFCDNGSLAYGVWGSSSTGRGVVGNGAIYGVYSFGQAAGTTGWANVSDVRFKHNIAPLENALDSILNLRGITYEYRRDEFKTMNFPLGTHIGFIAQEIEKILPQVVMTDENGYKSVTYANVVPVLVEAVKTLKTQKDAEINAIKHENAALKAKNEKLEARLDAIERALAELADKKR